MSELTDELMLVVLWLVPEAHLVKVAAADGRHFSITKHTAGVKVEQLREGQRLRCVVTRRLPRVLNAVPLD